MGGNRQQQNSNAFSIILKVYTFSYIDTESLDVGVPVHISNFLKSGHTNIFALFDYFELQINPPILARRNLDKYSELV